MASRIVLRKLKLPNRLTTRHIWMLKNEAGYDIVSENDKFIEFSRPSTFIRVKRSPELSETAKDHINRRLNAIVDTYIEPIFFRKEILNRIKNITKTLTSLESNYVWEWVENNLF